jgi:two-component system chemotaxis sensor kinase CheA
MFFAPEGNFAGLWVLAFPVLAVCVLGLPWGLLLAVLVLGFMLALCLVPDLAPAGAFYGYDPFRALRFGGAYLLISLIAAVSERLRIIHERRAEQLALELQVERDEIAAMKDNLKAGLFLLNRDFEIEPAYSRVLETILGEGGLEGKRFPDLFTVSLSSREKQALVDYLEMAINRSFDNKMLEEINPINEFTYVNATGEIEKILRSSFTPVDRGGGEFFILGALEDITAEKELERQLAQEEDQKEAEMRAFFQVIKVDPRVFGDFLEDTEYEFNRINEILKNKKLTSKEAVLRIYQCVHAIKSNALILGLEHFGGQLHGLEGEIKKLEEHAELSFTEVLHITVELEKVMRENDKLRDTIVNIQTFMGGDIKRQDRYVLVETLSRAVERAAGPQAKKAAFDSAGVDGAALEKAPRRIIKEILTQLVRNAVFHGIETPEERRRAGKDAEGHIRLALRQEGEKLHIRLSDDGRGLDFEKIRQRAEALHMLPVPEAGTDRNRLLQVIFAPGFSTSTGAGLHAGRGMGLSLVRDRVRALGGSIKLQTETGKGTSFHIYLPLEVAPHEN